MKWIDDESASYCVAGRMRQCDHTQPRLGPVIHALRQEPGLRSHEFQMLAKSTREGEGFRHGFARIGWGGRTNVSAASVRTLDPRSVFPV